MEHKIAVHKAQRTLEDRPVNDLFIRVSETIPSFPELSQSAKAFALDGKLLADALFDSLPGGTMDSLIAELLKRRASLFVVKF